MIAAFQQPPRLVQISERLAREAEPVGCDRAHAQEARAANRVVAQRRLDRTQPLQHRIRRLVVDEIGEALVESGPRIGIRRRGFVHVRRRYWRRSGTHW